MSKREPSLDELLATPHLQALTKVATYYETDHGVTWYYLAVGIKRDVRKVRALNSKPDKNYLRALEVLHDNIQRFSQVKGIVARDAVNGGESYTIQDLFKEVYRTIARGFVQERLSCRVESVDDYSQLRDRQMLLHINPHQARFELITHTKEVKRKRKNKKSERYREILKAEQVYFNNQGTLVGRGLETVDGVIGYSQIHEGDIYLVKYNLDSLWLVKHLVKGQQLNPAFPVNVEIRPGIKLVFSAKHPQGKPFTYGRKTATLHLDHPALMPGNTSIQYENCRISVIQHVDYDDLKIMEHVIPGATYLPEDMTKSSLPLPRGFVAIVPLGQMISFGHGPHHQNAKHGLHYVIRASPNRG